MGGYSIWAYQRYCGKNNLYQKKLKKYFNNKPLIVGLVKYFNNKLLWVGIVFEPIKDTVVNTTLYQFYIKNHFNNKPLSVGGYSIWAY